MKERNVVFLQDSGFGTLIDATKISNVLFFCLIVPNPLKEVLHIFQIQAPNMMCMKMQFAWSIIFPD